MKTTSSIMVPAMLLMAGIAQAQDAPPTAQEQFEDGVRALLSAVEREPTRKDFDRLGGEDRVVTELIRLADTDDPILSQRALATLGDFPSPKVRAYLEKRALDEKGDRRHRGKALIALGFAYQDEALDVIASQLETRDALLREDVIRAFAPMSGDKAEKLLRKRLEIEPAKHIGALLQGVIQGVVTNREKIKRPRGAIDQGKDGSDRDRR